MSGGMDVSNLVSAQGQERHESFDGRVQGHQYPTRHAIMSNGSDQVSGPYQIISQRQTRGHNGTAAASGFTRASPTKKDQKHVVFQLISTEDPRVHARLPMRVMIAPHDTTESIITTVKNFYGLYEQGVSFEDGNNINIIARYENFENDMTVYVRTVEQQSGTNMVNGEAHRDSLSPRRPQLGAPFEMRPPQQQQTFSPARPGSRGGPARSLSPQSNMSHRSVSAVPSGRSRGRQQCEASTYGDANADGYSSSDGGNGSVTSSRRDRGANAEISVENIVEGGRRKRAKFESSELPLFVPPQVPMTASISSISPQRRISGNNNAASPYSYSNQHTFSYTQPLPSPQSYGSGAHYLPSAIMSNGYNGAFQQPARQLRARGNGPVAGPPRQSTGGILPTPDPTVGSVISDEDVALQLMRLGDASNFSHGRTSTSTVDDALSGKAEAPSSDEESDDEEEASRLPAVPRFPKQESVGPVKKRQRGHNELPSEGTSEESEDHRDASFMGSDDMVPEYYDGTQRRTSKAKTATGSKRGSLSGSIKSTKPRMPGSAAKPKGKSNGFPKAPMSPSSLPAQSRKTSIASTINFQHQLGLDEEDLSSKPRCQRCRKSKKGCDRQRPCQRCKDAGIGVEGCLSEDEGNGRKGRYGRHMGVPVKKGDEMSPEVGMGPGNMPTNGYFLAPAPVDKSKKRKR